jgi:hypothetical protein
VSRKAWFHLGGLFGGRLFSYTGLGEFASHEAAVTSHAVHWYPPEVTRETAVTIETIPCVKHGVEYGYKRVVRDLAGRVLNV